MTKENFAAVYMAGNKSTSAATKKTMIQSQLKTVIIFTQRKHVAITSTLLTYAAAILQVRISKLF